MTVVDDTIIFCTSIGICMSHYQNAAHFTVFDITFKEMQ